MSSKGEFEKLAKSLNTNEVKAKLSIPQKIEMYGLWCVSTRGKCTRAKPSRLKPLEYGKWAAWKKYEHLSPEEARKQFIAKAKTIASKL